MQWDNIKHPHKDRHQIWLLASNIATNTHWLYRLLLGGKCVWVLKEMVLSSCYVTALAHNNSSMKITMS